MRNAEVNICLTVTSRESLVELLGVGSAMVMKCFSTGIDWDVSQIRKKSAEVGASSQQLV
jgi:predicted lactoylglutathione lyase